MSVEIDPAELGFRRPFTTEVSQVLKIKNPNHTPVAFKVKTTAPKQYCVRPNSGRIEPGKEVEVSVLLQAMKQEPPLDAKCRDKFLVQSVAVTADKEFTNIAAIWQHVDAADRASVHEKKIKVVFLPAQSPSSVAATPVRNGDTSLYTELTPNAAPPSYSSPAPEDTYTPSNKGTAPTGPVSTPDSRPDNAFSTASAAAKALSPVTDSTPKETIAAAIPQTYEELKVALADAQTKIASLSANPPSSLATGLRKRKASAEEAIEKSPTASAVARQVTHEGVPVKIVAALCFLSFLLAYLFF